MSDNLVRWARYIVPAVVGTVVGVVLERNVWKGRGQ